MRSPYANAEIFPSPFRVRRFRDPKQTAIRIVVTPQQAICGIPFEDNCRFVWISLIE